MNIFYKKCPNDCLAYFGMKHTPTLFILFTFHVYYESCRYSMMLHVVNHFSTFQN